MIDAGAKLGDTKFVNTWLERMKLAGFVPNGVGANAAVESYAKSSRLTEEEEEGSVVGMSLEDQLEQVRSDDNDPGRALTILNESMSQNIIPTLLAVNKVIHICMKSSNVDDCINILNQMDKLNVKPDNSIFSGMYKLFSFIYVEKNHTIL